MRGFCFSLCCALTLSQAHRVHRSRRGCPDTGADQQHLACSAPAPALADFIRQPIRCSTQLRCRPYTDTRPRRVSPAQAGESLLVTAAAGATVRLLGAGLYTAADTVPALGAVDWRRSAGDVRSRRKDVRHVASPGRRR